MTNKSTVNLKEFLEEEIKKRQLYLNKLKQLVGENWNSIDEQKLSSLLLKEFPEIWDAYCDQLIREE